MSAFHSPPDVPWEPGDDPTARLARYEDALRKIASGELVTRPLSEPEPCNIRFFGKGTYRLVKRLTPSEIAREALEA